MQRDRNIVQIQKLSCREAGTQWQSERDTVADRKRHTVVAERQGHSGRFRDTVAERQ